MKTRKGFVSNSSSSSFICDACGETIFGWNMYPEATCDAFEHKFCESCKPEYEPTEEEVNQYFQEVFEGKHGEWTQKNVDKEEFEAADVEERLEWFRELYDYNDLPSFACPVCQMEIITDTDLKRYLQTVTGILDNEVFAWIKQQNKRRRHIYDNEYINYTCNKLDKTNLQVVNEIKTKFSTYEEFISYKGET